METKDIIYTTPVQQLDFFNFSFDVMDGQVLKCTMDGQPIDTAIGSGLFIIKQKYDKNKAKMNRNKKLFNAKKEHYQETMDKWIVDREHLRKHIVKCESKLTEYKNTILAFGKLASAGAISK